jgi:hypothetical protein
LSLLVQNCSTQLVISGYPVVFARIIQKIENMGAECRIKHVEFFPGVVYNPAAPQAITPAALRRHLLRLWNRTTGVAALEGV